MSSLRDFGLALREGREAPRDHGGSVKVRLADRAVRAPIQNEIAAEDARFSGAANLLAMGGESMI